MKVGKIKNRAKKFLGVNKYHPLLLNAAMTGIVVVILMLTFALSRISGWKWLMWYGLVLLAAFYVFAAPIEYSATDFYLRACNSKGVETFKLFEGFKKENFWRSVLIRLIRTGMGLGLTILLIVPGIIFFMRTAFVYFVINNNPDTKAWDAFRESNQLVKGHTSEFFKICCSFIGWFLLGIVTFGLAFIYVSPYYHTVKNIYYRHFIMGVSDAAQVTAPKSAAKSAPKSNGELNSEIDVLEKQIKAMENAQVKNAGGESARSKAPPLEKDRTVSDSATPVETVEIVADAEEGSTVAAPTDTPPEPLVLDEVGDVTLNSSDRVEEVELPKAENKEEEKAPPENNRGKFVTREVEIMENESFEDFKARIAKIRQARDAEKPVAPQRPNAEQSANGGNGQQRRLSREEILEKLKREGKIGK